MVCVFFLFRLGLSGGWKVGELLGEWVFSFSGGESLFSLWFSIFLFLLLLNLFDSVCFEFVLGMVGGIGDDSSELKVFFVFVEFMLEKEEGRVAGIKM